MRNRLALYNNNSIFVIPVPRSRELERALVCDSALMRESSVASGKLFYKQLAVVGVGHA